MMVEVAGIRKEFISGEGDVVVAVDDVGFEVEEGKLFTLLGPSGCGKTTTLRALAGLERTDGGEIRIDGELMASEDTFVFPENRDIGFVFQSYALWPHMTARQNILYALQNYDYPKSEREDRIQSVLELVGLPDVGERYPSELSGGQQQRIALARALAHEPTLLLMDEPLSNLDFQLRKEMRGVLLDILDEVGTTTIYVTHNQEEAFELSDELAVMNRGSFIQSGKPQELYSQPSTPFVADFLGESNIIEVTVENVVDDETAVCVIEGEESDQTVTCRYLGQEPEQRQYAVVRPENVRLRKDPADVDDGQQKTPVTNGGTIDQSHVNTFRGSVQDQTYKGRTFLNKIRIDNTEINADWNDSDIRPGDEILVEMDVQDVLLIGDEI